MPSTDPVVKPVAQCTQRSTPMRDRVEKVDVVVKPTPEGFREVVALNVRFADCTDAKTVFHKHQKKTKKNSRAC
jgi:hypothetical protein